MFSGQTKYEKPKSPAKLKIIYEKKQVILNKWRDGKNFDLSILKNANIIIIF